MKTYGFTGLVVATLLSTPSAAQAAWSVTTEDRVAVRAVVLPPMGDPGAVVRGSRVTVDWPVSSFGRVRGYRVERTNQATGRSVEATGQCAGLITATRCVEADVPDGRWRYSVVAVVGTAWTSEPGVGEAVPVWTRPPEPEPGQVPIPVPSPSPDGKPIPHVAPMPERTASGAAPAPDETAPSDSSTPAGAASPRVSAQPGKEDEPNASASAALSASGVAVPGDDVLG